MTNPSKLDINTVVAVAVMLFISIIAVFFYNQPHGDLTTVPDERVYSLSDLKQKADKIILFYSEVFLSREKTEITIPFAPKGRILIAWVGYIDKNNAYQRYLINHPQLLDISWPFLNQKSQYLYQKKPTYQTIESFLDNPPNMSVVAADPDYITQYPQLAGAKPTDNTFDLEQIDYILTTFNKPTLQSGVYVYKNIIDASSATLNDQNQIEWLIQTPDADLDSPYLLGPINIQYIQ